MLARPRTGRRPLQPSHAQTALYRAGTGSSISLCTVAAALAMSSVAVAGTVDVGIAADSATVTVVARDASVGEILSALAEKGRVVAEIPQGAGKTERSGHWQGSLLDVLERILRNENRFISGTGSAADPLRVVLLARSQPGDVASARSGPSRGTPDAVPVGLPTAPAEPASEASAASEQPVQIQNLSQMFKSMCGSNC